MKKLSPLLAAIALTSGFATAQPMPGEHRAPRVDVVKLLGLDADRAQKVDAILANARERMIAARREIGRPTDDTTRTTMHAAMQAIHQDTDKQLAEVLSPDELAKLRDAMPKPPRRRS
jgi:hypothetical protein